MKRGIVTKICCDNQKYLHILVKYYSMDVNIVETR